MGYYLHSPSLKTRGFFCHFFITFSLQGCYFCKPMKRNLILPLFLSMALFSCEKAVDIKLDNVSPKLVVEATIENNTVPVVALSKSLGYFSAINPTILAGSFVHDAEVYVSNGTLTHKLKEYGVPAGNGYTFYYYSVDPANMATAFTGVLDKQYSLRIVAEGKEYTATTRIPLISKRIDSLYWKQAPAGNDSSKVILMLKVTDPPGYGDYIRYFTKRNSEPFFAGLNSVFDDQIIDGTTYTIPVDRGTDRTEVSYDDEAYFNKGDTVTLKLCNIDKATYDFWRTMEFSYASVGNPFSSPTKVVNNIKGDALGYFGGYASQYRTIIIPR